MTAMTDGLARGTGLNAGAGAVLLEDDSTIRPKADDS
ncbi:hypothetical protein BH23ACT2_BH23ACT2_20490 [soil metagenome]